MTDTLPIAMQSAQHKTRTQHLKQALPTGLQTLVYRISQLAHETEGPLTLAFTALEPGSPSRQLAQRISLELAQNPEHRVLYADLGALISSADSENALAEHVRPTSVPGLCQITGTDPNGSGSAGESWRNNAAFRQGCLARLGAGFNYVLLGCPALDESHDALGIAAFLDGFVLMVNAEHTQKGDFLRAEHMILNAGGRLLGSVLNNTTEPAPAWALGKR